MATPTPDHRKLARWLLASEAGDQEERLAAAADRVWEKLAPHLAAIVSGAGVRALGRRAVFLARDDFVFLDGGANAGLDELGAALSDADQAEAAKAAEAVYANFLNLLTTFIGEGLALHAIRRVWPEATLREPGSSAEEARS